MIENCPYCRTGEPIVEGGHGAVDSFARRHCLSILPAARLLEFTAAALRFCEKREEGGISGFALLAYSQLMQEAYNAVVKPGVPGRIT